MSRRYRGRHRANQFSIRVDDLLVVHKWHITLGRPVTFRSPLTVESILIRGANAPRPVSPAEERDLIDVRFAAQMHALGFGGLR